MSDMQDVEIEMKGQSSMADAVDAEESLNAFTWDACFVFKVGDENVKVTQATKRAVDENEAAALAEASPDDSSVKLNAAHVRSRRVSSVVDTKEVSQKEKWANQCADVVARLTKAGFKTDMYYSVQKDEIYVRVGATEKRLMVEAERIKYDLQLDEDAVIREGNRLGVQLASKITSVEAQDAEKDKFIPKTVFKHIYGRYDQPNVLTPAILEEKKIYEAKGELHPKDDHWRQSLYYRYPSSRRLEELRQQLEEAKKFRDPAAPEKPTKDESIIAQEIEGMEWDAQKRPNTLFTSTDRLKLMVAAIEARVQYGGADISFSALLEDEDHCLIAFFPLHENHKKEVLMKKWFKLKSTFAGPIDDIREYFGEQIGFYFAFLQFYNRQLVLPAIIGLIVFVWQLSEDRIDIDIIPAYAIFVALWATIFLEVWKRSEAEYRVHWGMVNFAAREQPRPEFIRNCNKNKDEGWMRTSRVDGSSEAHMPLYVKFIRILISQSVIWFLIAIVLAAVFGILLFRAFMAEVDEGSAAIVTGILNAIQIQILNVVYTSAAQYFNEYENHRTDSDYMNALIAKNFLFKFVNSYNSFFYIAFYKRHDSTLDDANDPTKTRCLHDNDCLKELRDQLGTIFISLIVINNLIEVVIPYLMQRYQENQNRARADTADMEAGHEFKPLSQPEKEFNLAPYESTFDDFDELVVQFGFCALFVVAFPVAPLAALLNNVLETRVDASKLCMLARRPEPRGAYDIGTWSDILNIISFIAVMTNAALIVFETERFQPANSDGVAEQYVTFIVAEHLIILLKFAIAYFVPDESEDLVEHRERQAYIVGVLIDGVDIEETASAAVGEERDMPEQHNFDWSAVNDSIQQDGKSHA